MEFHGEFSMEIHGIPWNSMEVFHTANCNGRGEETMNHGTIAIQNHNTIQSCLHEPCGCGELNDSLKRMGKTNQSGNAAIIYSDMQRSDPLCVMS